MTPDQVQQIGRCILEEAQDAFIVVSPVNLQLVEANPAAHRLMGYSSGQLLNRALPELFGAEQHNGLNELTRACQTTSHLRENGGYFLKTYDNNQIPVHVTVSRIPSDSEPLALLALRDLTREMQTEKALRESEFRHRSVVEGSLQGILIHQDARIRYVNEALVRMFDYDSPDELVGQPLWNTLVMAENRVELQKRTAAILAGKWTPPHPGWRAVGKTGRSIWVATAASLIEWQGRPAVVSFYLDVTERIRAEEALRESEARCRTLVENAPESIVVLDVELGTFVDANENACRLFDMDRARLLRIGPIELSPPFQPDGQLSLDKGRKLVQQTMAGDVPRFEWLHRDGAGREIPCEVFLVRLPSTARNLVRGSIVDITERKKIEEAANTSRRMLQLVLDNIPQGVFWKDRDSRYLGCNLVVCRAFGLQHPAQIRGMDDYQLPGLSREQAEFFIEKDRRVIASNSPELGIIESATLADGNSIWMETSKLPMHDEAGKVIGILGTWQDITERKRAEEERRKLDFQLQHTQKLESLGILAGGIAHDFNNLLTSILGYADLALLELPRDSSTRHLIEEVMNGARRAAELTNQMLAYSGKGHFVLQPINLSEIVDNLRRLLQVSISKKCVVQCNLMPHLPAVEADAAQMRQIVMNLIINASEAIGDQHGVIAVTTGAMHCGRAYLADAYLDEKLEEGPFVFLEVADTGIGMDAETRKKIFDPFFTTKFTGRGLGLAAVLGIVRGHGGAIKVYSEPGKGTTFKVLFPTTGQLAPTLSPQPTPHPEWRGSGMALLVDDEAPLRAMAQYMLQTMGFTVLTAADGREALDIFRRESKRLVLVLLDMTMPHLDGAETFREMKSIRNDVRVILSSGYNEQTATSQFSGKGLAGFIQKPYSYEELATVIRKAFEPNQGIGSRGLDQDAASP